MATAKKNKKKSKKKVTKKTKTKKKTAKKSAKKAKPAKKKPAAKKAKAAKKKTASKKSAAKKVTKGKTTSKKASKSQSKTARKSSNTKKSAVKKTTIPKLTTKKSVAVIELKGLFTPLDDRLIIQFEETSDMTAGGIIIPGSSTTERPNKGKVLAVGRGHLNDKGKIRPMDVQVGDQVLFSGYAGNTISMGNADVLVVRESDILGIVD